MKKKLLVTGSNGLLGQMLTEASLETSRIELVATSRGSNRYPIKNGYIYVDLDITDDNALEQVIRRERPDCIINAAAMTNVDACEEYQDECRRLNVDAVAHLVALCKTYHIHLIQLSTDFIFDGKTGPYLETDLPNPLNFYGKTKLEAERLIEQSPISSTIIRTILVYGVLSDISKSNIVLWAKKALENGDTMRIVHDQWRTPTLADDLAKACLYAALNEIKGTFHVSGDELLSVADMIEKIAEFWALDTSNVTTIDSQTLNQRAARPARTGFILDKAKSKLNLPSRSLKEGLSIVNDRLNQLTSNSEKA